MPRQKAPSLRELGYLPDLLTTSQAAELLQLSHDHLRVLLRAGELQGVRVTGSWRIPREAILTRLEPTATAPDAGQATARVSDSRRAQPDSPVARESDSAPQSTSITQREAAERLGISQKTISRMLARGQLTPITTGRKGGATRVAVDERWSDTHRAQG
ncbi:MAG TPA: helix-turn-helix domain-containing protein [Solirubrobacteraceae bacterium]|nr:helix-turn-helix domain-containing protein [Solirubrobacteraceae bacterium]